MEQDLLDTNAEKQQSCALWPITKWQQLWSK
jgi:hypothetical protein